MNILHFLYSKCPRRLALYFVLLILEVCLSTLVVISLIPLTDYFVRGDSLVGGNNVTVYLASQYSHFGLNINLLTIAAPFLIANLARSIVEILNRKTLLGLKYTATREINNRLLFALFYTDFSIFREYQHGKYMNIFNKEVLNISDGIGQFGIGLASLLQVLVYIILPFTLSFHLAISVFISLILVSVPFFLLQKSSLKFGKRWVKSSNLISSFVSEHLTGYQHIVTNNYQDRTIGQFNKLYDQYILAAEKSQLLKTAVPRLFTPLGMLVLILSVYFQRDEIPLSTLAAVVWSYISILPLISTIIQANLSIRNLLPSYKHVNSVINRGNFNLNSSKFGSKKEIGFQKGFEFRNIELSYKGGKIIFSNFNAQIPAKKVTVLLGPSGVGKTTLINLLIGLIYPNAGSVCIDGDSIYDFDLRSYRSLFGYLSQNHFLFNASIRENLLISNPYATEIELDLALERSGLYYEISNDILDLKSLVGENGQNLSGGQRQRLSLAMVLIKSPKVLILDEPTSALDETADQAIWNIISDLSKEITVVVITHRLANVNESYNIIKLDFELNKN